MSRSRSPNSRRRCVAAGVQPHEAQVAKYALCGTADDIVQNLPGTDRHVWLQYSMLAQFFQVRTSGVGFFEELNKALANPAPHYNLLELMHACLLLGFEGQYRGAAGGDNELQRVRRDVYQTLRHVKARADDDISPRWRGLSLQDAAISTAACRCGRSRSGAAAVLVGVFFLLRFLIGNDGDALARAAGRAASERRRSASTRPEFKTYEPPVVARRRRSSSASAQRSADEIKAGGMAVEPVGDQIVVRVSNLVLFASGKADTKPEFAAGRRQDRRSAGQGAGPDPRDRPYRQCEAEELERLQVELRPVGGARQIGRGGAGEVAHRPDAHPGRGQGRARADRRQQDGGGQAQNRRVEIMIPKEETLQGYAGGGANG